MAFLLVLAPLGCVNPLANIVDDTSNTTGSTSAATTGTAATGAATTGAATTGMENDTDTTSAPPADVGIADSGTTETGDCKTVVNPVSPQPADIIVVVDSSGSMQLEAGFVQNNMNVFSSQIFLANIDAHVVLISATSNDDTGICIPMPLGSGACPDDTRLPGYFHIPDGVGSNDGLQKILDHYADLAPHMRPTASKHIIMVTDDDSDLSANDFNNQFLALDASHAGYKFHAIASPEDPVVACIDQTSCCPGFIPLSAALSEEHIELVNLTGGVFGNLCEQSFGPIFDEVSMQVVSGAALACEYPIPPPPDGMDFDPDQVNVGLFDSIGSALELGRVDGTTQCADVSDAWYYDVPSAPTRIVLCPQTCDTLQGFGRPSVSVEFGCATIPAG